MAQAEKLKHEETRREMEKPPEVVEKPEERIETPEALSEFGEQTAAKVEETSAEAIEAGTHQIESAVTSVGGGSEDIEAGKAALFDVQKEIKDLSLEIQERVGAEIENRELIEALRKECSEPIPDAKDMPVYSFKDLMEKFKTTDLKAIVESDEYKKMISKGFVLGSGEERVYYGEKPGRISEKEPANIHLGVDYMVKEETEINAIADGEIVDVKSVKAPRLGRKHLYKGEGGFGNMILMKHKLESGQEVYSLYGHLGYSKEQLKPGDIIKKDQIIGRVGKSFSVENGGWPSHLHFSILKEQEAIAGYGTKKDTEKIVDPLKVFRKETEVGVEKEKNSETLSFDEKHNFRIEMPKDAKEGDEIKLVFEDKEDKPVLDLAELLPEETKMVLHEASEEKAEYAYAYVYEEDEILIPAKTKYFKENLRAFSIFSALHEIGHARNYKTEVDKEARELLNKLKELDNKIWEEAKAIDPRLTGKDAVWRAYVGDSRFMHLEPLINEHHQTVKRWLPVEKQMEINASTEALKIMRQVREEKNIDLLGDSKWSDVRERIIKNAIEERGKNIDWRLSEVPTEKMLALTRERAAMEKVIEDFIKANFDKMQEIYDHHSDPKDPDTSYSAVNKVTDKFGKIPYKETFLDLAKIAKWNLREALEKGDIEKFLQEYSLDAVANIAEKLLEEKNKK